MKYYAIDSSVFIDKANDAQALHAAFKMDEALICFSKFEDAALAAKDAADPKAKAQFPIYEIEFKGRKGRTSSTHELKNGTVIAAFNIIPNEVEDFALLKATFSHINKKFKAIDLTNLAEENKEENQEENKAENKAEDKAEDKAPADEQKEEPKAEDKKEDVAKKSSNTYIKAAGAAAAAAVVGTGFWFSGFYPAAIALLAKAGLALPAAAIGVQIGVSAAIGFAAVAVLGAAYYGINKLFGSDTPAEPVVDNRTEAQKYSDKLKSKEDKIKARSEKLTSEQDKKFLTDLHAILDIEHTAVRKFKKDGAAMSDRNQPKQLDKLLVLRYEAKCLKEVVAAEGAKRAEVETAALAKATEAAKKKFVA